MLAVGIFVGVFVLLALGVVLIGANGGAGGARQRLHSENRTARVATNGIMVIVYAAFGIAIPVLLLTGNHSNASAQVGGAKLTMGEKVGRELFGEHCGVCHTLNAANAIGKVGPNLDILKPGATIVLNTIQNGCLQSPPPGSNAACLGFGNMPANVVEGKDATDVANFVAKVAGHE